MSDEKAAVQEFWEQASCGEALYLRGNSRSDYEEQARIRYELEPFIPAFAEFNLWHGKQVLEIGVGLGADHQMFAQGGARLAGIDLTPRAVGHAMRRFQAMGLKSDLRVGDAENLPFPDCTFDLVYSWGVLHHSPDTRRAVDEVLRVLKPDGEARIMIYHKYSVVGLMLWIRYALLRLKPSTDLKEIYAKYLESPGTKAYSVEEARQLFEEFSDVGIRTVLTHGDLLMSSAGQRHQGPLLTIARVVWPRRTIRRFFPHCGLFMLISARRAGDPKA